MSPEEFHVRPYNPPPPPQQAFAWPKTFRTDQPLDLEIGCGVGWHPIRYAKENPDRSLIAIEHTRDKFQKFTHRLEHHEPLANLFAVHADAVRWTTENLEPRSIDRCFILYPNPEPKAASQRWIRMPYMHALKNLMKQKGELIFATNEAPYALEIETWARQYWRFQLLEKRILQKTDVPRTHFEKKYLARGETCTELRFGITHD